MDEEFCAALLNIPNRGMELYAKLQKLPAQAVEVWDTDQKEMATLGRFGKRLADRYLNIPEFEHKEAALFLAWYASNFGMKLIAMRSLMPKDPQ